MRFVSDGYFYYFQYTVRSHRNVSAEIQRRVMDCVNYVQHNEMIQNEEVSEIAVWALPYVGRHSIQMAPRALLILKRIS